jgi:hypothetical protein
VKNPFERGAAIPPPTLGEGCVRRYDPDALSDEQGAEFAEAAELWAELRQLPVDEEQEPETK